MRNHSFKIFLSIFFFLIVGCLSNDFYYLEFKDIKDGWSKNETLKFRFTPNNTAKSLKILIRNDKSYPYSNLFLISKIKFKNRLLIDTLNLDFEDEEIDIFKTNSLGLKNYSFILKDSINFDADSVELYLQHAIRSGESLHAKQNINGLLNIGLLVENIE